MYPTIVEIQEEQRKKKKRNRFYALILAFVYGAVILIFIGKMHWGQIPLFIEAVIICFLWDFGPLKKILGEEGRPQRSKFNYGLSWIIGVSAKSS